MFAPKHIMDYVVDCSILYKDPDNLSGHFAISLSLELPTKYVEPSSSSDGHHAAPCFSNFPWNDTYFQEKYSYEVSVALEELNCMIPVNNTVKAVSEEINTLCNLLCHVLKESATKAMSKCPIVTVQKKKSKHKQWWNQYCSAGRKRNNLYFYIWKIW